MATEGASPRVPGELERALRRTVAATTRTDHAAAARAGLTLSTCYGQVLDLLLLHGPLSPSQLSKLSGITSSGTMTGSIDALERAGYVRRVRSVTDRRKVVVELDEERLRRATSDRARRIAALVRDYDEEQKATIVDFLDRLTRAESADPPETGAS
ncbi:MarR family winged helix-turn-helix transcriptional regulator [Phytohabitans kaempferiae]|uniref:MarR family winged helix-turn-helix transcriptional regulator n=1 Tax=Phytohabitans kaempferiae TaxID=1620943 RepID=A0ABV6MAR3_9ACTN